MPMHLISMFNKDLRVLKKFFKLDPNYNNLYVLLQKIQT